MGVQWSFAGPGTFILVVSACVLLAIKIHDVANITTNGEHGSSGEDLVRRSLGAKFICIIG